MKNKYKLGIVGVGIMASSILDGIVKHINECSFKLQDILIYDPDTTKTDKYHKIGICVAESVEKIFAESEYVLLCTKPQQFEEVINSCKIINCYHIISIMAGIKIKTIFDKIAKKEIGITRVMPNLPCKIGAGVSAMTFFNEENKEFVSKLFSFCGKFIIIDEDKFDAVTSISGSGPSYVFMFADALITAGINGGLTFEESKTLALATIEGSCTLADSASEDLSTLINNVCSKGGTTIEAVNSFKEDKLYEIIEKGVRLCREKSEFLSKKY